MHVLVTGGLGHIGSALIRSAEFRAVADSVSVVDNFCSERYCSLFDLNPSQALRFRRQDVRDLSPEDLTSIDVVIHLAAQTDATASLDQREAVFANNLTCTEHLVSLVRETRKRLVFASTTSVYGSQALRVDETCDQLIPQSPYAECKLLEEAAIRQASETGADAIILRLGTIAGPSPGMRFHTAVNKFCLQARLGEPLSVWQTAWQQLRPYLDIEDAARALAWSTSVRLPQDLQRDPVLNVVTENMTVEAIVSAVQSAFGEVKVEFTESRIMNQLSYEVSADRIASLGFLPTGSVSAAIRRTAQLLSGFSG